MRVCTIIVTYNRKEMLLRCIKACLSQTFSTDILIYDNHSTDGTGKYLKQAGIIDKRNVIYYYAKENLGGAGGFSTGLKMAYEREYDFFWLMDDDGYPANDRCLEMCFDSYNSLKNDDVILNSAVVCDDYETLSFGTGGLKTITDLIANSQKGVYRDFISPFNGTLLSKNVVRKIGFPRGDFFIKGDETEYIRRAQSKNVCLFTSVNSLFVHPKLCLERKRVLFFTYEYAEESFWKEYYHTRNYVYIYKKYYGKQVLMKHFVRTMLNCLTYKNDRKKKRRYALKGLIDGIRGNFTNIDIKT
ncbi:glycosyltransferase [Butyrivibrio sp. AE3004]|uniref:glycosyltransferase n=1 Tax=Butyrivibrio sp. AE3004 TaxID=1506994 RepID=UPI00068CE4C1|nr:glycosyltransferase [Butyrivibrio sp. AE3004]